MHHLFEDICHLGLTVLEMVDCSIYNSWILISSSCQTSSVHGVTPRLKSFLSKASCSCMIRCLQRRVHLLASLHSYCASNKSVHYYCYIRWYMYRLCSNLIVVWINLIYWFTVYVLSWHQEASKLAYVSIAMVKSYLKEVWSSSYV